MALHMNMFAQLIFNHYEKIKILETGIGNSKDDSKNRICIVKLVSE
jgi:hypothetical protein